MNTVSITIYRPDENEPIEVDVHYTHHQPFRDQEYITLGTAMDQDGKVYCLDHYEKDQAEEKAWMEVGAAR